MIDTAAKHWPWQRLSRQEQEFLLDIYEQVAEQYCEHDEIAEEVEWLRVAHQEGLLTFSYDRSSRCISGPIWLCEIH